jgi:hypothetical protein
MENYNLIDAALANDKEAFMQAFNFAISNKVSDALEIKKVEIASNILTQPEDNTNEINTIETEVDGANDSTEFSSEYTAAE